MPKVVPLHHVGWLWTPGCGDRPNGRDTNRTELTRDPFPT